MNIRYNGINLQNAVQPSLPNWGDLEGWSRDPMFEKYPSISPYTYCSNNPVGYVDPTGGEFGPPIPKGSILGPCRLLASPTLISSGMNFCSETVRGTFNTVLFVGGIGQIIGGNIANGIKGGYNYPSWGIPLQLNKNWKFESKTSWMGFGATGDISKEAAVEIAVNTFSADLFFLSFSKSPNAVARIFEDQTVGAIVSTAVSVTVDAVKDNNNTQKSNSNSTTKTSSSTQNASKSLQKSKSSNLKPGWSLYINQNNNENKKNSLLEY